MNEVAVQDQELEAEDLEFRELTEEELDLIGGGNHKKPA